MNERSRNIAVGVTVLTALVLLAGLVLVFARAPRLLSSGYVVRARMRTSGGVNTGDPVHFIGMKIGHVRDVRLIEPDNPLEGMYIVMQINEDYRLPGRSELHITAGMMGNQYLEITASADEPAVDPKTGQPLKWLPKDYPATIEGKWRSSNPMSQLEPAMEKFGALAENLNNLLAPPAEPAAQTAPTTQPTTTAATQPDDGIAPTGRQRPAGHGRQTQRHTRWPACHRRRRREPQEHQGLAGHIRQGGRRNRPDHGRVP
jgi:ABC-type transporter Mla subunit MlaD